MLSSADIWQKEVSECIGEGLDGVEYVLTSFCQITAVYLYLYAFRLLDDVYQEFYTFDARLRRGLCRFVAIRIISIEVWPFNEVLIR